MAIPKVDVDYAAAKELVKQAVDILLPNIFDDSYLIMNLIDSYYSLNWREEYAASASEEEKETDSNQNLINYWKANKDNFEGVVKDDIDKAISTIIDKQKSKTFTYAELYK